MREYNIITKALLV